MKPEQYTFTIYHGNVRGTAFLVHEDGILATCFHTIQHAFGKLAVPQGQMLKWRTLDGSEGMAVVLSLYDKSKDVALLQVAGTLPSGLEPVPLVRSDAVEGAMKFSTQGYGRMIDRGHTYQRTSAIGEIVGTSERDGIQVIQLKSSDLLEGMSGAPIYCKSVGGVVGLLSARYSVDPNKHYWMRDTGWAAQSEAIVSLDPDRLVLHDPLFIDERSAFSFVSNVLPSYRVVGGDQHVGQYIENQNLYVYQGDMGIKKDWWERPGEFDPGRRWLQAVPREALFERLLQDLDAKTPGTQIVALYGVDGAGKTTLASMFVENYGDGYDGGVLWVDLGFRFNPDLAIQQILNQWANHAHKNAPPMYDQARQGSYDASVVRTLLAGHGEMLVVFDDVWDVSHINPLMEALPREANILITTNDERIAREYRQVPVGELTEAESLELLQQEIADLPSDQLLAIAAKLSFHAQALNLAVRTIAPMPNHARAVETFLARGLGEAGASEYTQAFRYSYEALDRSEQSYVRKLGVLYEANTSFDADLVCALWEIDTVETERVLSILQQRSFLSLAYNEDENATTHWYFPSLMGVFMADILRAEGEWDATYARYEDFLLGADGDWLTTGNHELHMLYVGERILDRLENRFHYDRMPLEVGQFEIAALAEEERDQYEQIALFFHNTRGYFLQEVEASRLNERWHAAQVVLGDILDEVDLIMGAWTFWARWLMNDGELEEALALAQKLQKMNAERRNREIGGWILNLTGNIYVLMGDTAQAISEFNKSLDYSEGEGADLTLTCHNLLSLSGLYLLIGDSHNASDVLERLMPLSDELDDPYISTTVIHQLGGLRINQKNVEDARSLFESAMETARRRGHEPTIAEITTSMGLTYLHEGDLDQAEACFKEGLTLAESLGYSRLITISLNNLGVVSSNRGDLEQAKTYFQRAERILADYPNANMLAQIRAFLGEIAFMEGDSEGALVMLEETLPSLQSIQNNVAAMRVINTLGAIYQRTGRIEEGLAFFHEIQDTIKSWNNEEAEMTLLNWISILLHGNGNYQRAMEYFDHALSIIDRLKDDEARATALSLVSAQYRLLGEVRHAQKKGAEACSLWRQLKNTIKLGESLVALAEVNLLLYEYDDAQNALDELKALLNASPSVYMEAHYKNTQGLLYMHTGRAEAAEEMFEEAARLGDILGDQMLRALCLNNLGMIESGRGDYEKSIARLKAACEITGEIDHPPLVATMQFNLGILYYVGGKYDKSIENVKKAIATLEEAEITVDAANQSVDMMRSYLMALEGRKNTPDESIQLLLRATQWDAIIMTIQARQKTLLQPAIDELFSGVIRVRESRGEQLLSDVLRAYRELLAACRAHPLDVVFNRVRSSFVTPTIEQWWAYLHRGSLQYAAALSCLNRVLESDRNNAEALLQRAWIFRGLKRYPQALADFERAEDLLGKDYRTAQGSGVVFFETKTYPDALTYLSESIRRQENPYSYQWRSAVYTALGDLPSAAEDLNKAIELDKRNSDHHFWRGLIALEMTDYDRAEDALDFVVEMDKDDPIKLSAGLFWRSVLADLRGARPAADGDRIQLEKTNKVAMHPSARWLDLIYWLHQDNVDDAHVLYDEFSQYSFPYHIVQAQERNLNLLSKLYPEKEHVKRFLEKITVDYPVPRLDFVMST